MPSHRPVSRSVPAKQQALPVAEGVSRCACAKQRKSLYFENDQARPSRLNAVRTRVYAAMHPEGRTMFAAPVVSRVLLAFGTEELARVLGETIYEPRPGKAYCEGYDSHHRYFGEQGAESILDERKGSHRYRHNDPKGAAEASYLQCKHNSAKQESSYGTAQQTVGEECAPWRCAVTLPAFNCLNIPRGRSDEHGFFLRLWL